MPDGLCVCQSARPGVEIPGYELPATLGCAAAPVLAGARQDANVLMAPAPDAAKGEQEYGFADAVVTGDTVHLSGVGWDDVVEITTFHTDPTTQLPGITEIKIVAKVPGGAMPATDRANR